MIVSSKYPNRISLFTVLRDVVTNNEIPYAPTLSMARVTPDVLTPT